MSQKFDTNIEYVQVEKLNLDFECYYDFCIGKGIRIQSTESFTKKGIKVNGSDTKKTEKIWDGLQSPFFGSDFADEYAFAERYACKCRKCIGKAFAGHICESCHTPVEYIDVDMEKTGWIIIDHFKVLSPIYCMKLSEALGVVEGEKLLLKILDTPFDDSEKIMTERDAEILKKHPYCNKGMLWLTQNIDEVLDYYAKRKPAKAKFFKELKEDKDKVFTHSIPVYTSVLRIENPGEKDKKLFKLRVNTLYMSIIRSVNRINKFGDPSDLNDKAFHTIDRYLCMVQKEIMNLFMEIFKILDGKKGIIQGRVISGRMNFSARNIITSDSGFLRADEVLLGYVTFMELFRYEITNIYAKLQSCTIVEANFRWKKALIHFDPVFYNIMDHMVKTNKSRLNVIINRNPSIDFGSFLSMKVAGVKRNINDKTMTIPTRILNCMAADFDGDMLNIFRVIGDDFGNRFAKNMNPRYNLYINRIDGKVNPDMMCIKDETTCFFQFNNC